MFSEPKLFELLSLWRQKKNWLKVSFMDGSDDEVRVLDFYMDSEESVIVKIHSKKKDQSLTRPLGDFLVLNRLNLRDLDDALINAELMKDEDDPDLAPQADQLENHSVENHLVENRNEQFVFTVSELTKEVKALLTNEFEKIWVKGEISEVNFSYSGHLFLTLKDEDALLSMVMFSSSLKKMKFKISAGLQVKCFGSLSLYEKRGTYQLIVDSISPEGQGELDLAFRQLYEKLSKEGLFAERHKKKIPLYPERVAIVTSPYGAALRDILKTISIEYPEMEIYIFPVAVQGEKAHLEIAQMIDYVDKMKMKFDVIVLTRGGGAREDLWAFNEEKVARAIYHCSLPIISAVGHEVDHVIADLVADRRVATPTAAAECITKHKKELVYQLNEVMTKLFNLLQLRYQLLVSLVNQFSIAHLFKQLASLLDNYTKDLNFLSKRMFFSIEKQLTAKKTKMDLLKTKLFSLSPQAVMKRGYHVVVKDEKIVSDLGQLKKSDFIKIKNHLQEKDAQIL